MLILDIHVKSIYFSKEYHLKYNINSFLIEGLIILAGKSHIFLLLQRIIFIAKEIRNFS